MTSRGEKWESADKPGSVEGNHSSGMRVAAHLKRPTRKRARAARCGFHRVFPYLVLLPAGFALPSPLPSTRCALTAPFQPCRHACARLGGLFSVALSVGLRPPGVTWRRAMRSPDFPLHSCENSDCLADSRTHLSASARPASSRVGGRVFRDRERARIGVIAANAREACGGRRGGRRRQVTQQHRERLVELRGGPGSACRGAFDEDDGLAAREVRVADLRAPRARRGCRDRKSRSAW